MTETELRETIAEIVRKQLRLSGPLPEGDLAESLDSVQRLTLVVAIEDHFEIAFEPEDDDAVRTLDELITLLQRRLAEHGKDAPHG